MSRQHANQIVVLLGHEAGEQADAGTRARCLDVDEHVGGRDGLAHGNRELAGQIEFVDLQHRVDEIHERVFGQLFGTFGHCILT